MTVLFAGVTSFPVFNGLQQGELALLTALLAGMVLMGSIALIIYTQERLFRVLHIFTAILAFTLLLPDLVWSKYLFSLALLSHLIYVLKFKHNQLFLVCCVAVVGYLVLLTCHIIWFWPSVFIVCTLLPIYLAQFYFASLAAQVSSREQYNEPSADHSHDLLGLPDRAGLRTAFNQHHALESTQSVMVLIRLEGFEQVNIHLGREFGDLLLAQSANRIKQQLQNHDVVAIANGNDMSRLAHLGGLHFVFMCSLEHQQHLHEQLINNILQSTLKPFNVGNCTIEITARASYVDSSQEHGQFDNLLACAFLALDSDPKRTITEYSAQMQTARLEQQARLAELTHHDFKEQLELYFQPVIRHEDGGIEFVELLLRWQHPQQGILPASQFIDDIRIAGLALPVAQYVIERAAEIALALKMDGQKVALSVNVFGPEMLHEEFIEFLDGVLLEHHLEAGDLIIECPSSLFMSLDPQGVAMVARLRSIGVRLCVDGFGETPLVLAKLPKLTVDYVKVGRSLTYDHQHQGSLRGIVRGVVDMQHQLDCQVICEGIESQEQLSFAKNLNTFAAQGYLFERPLSSVGMLSWLKRFELDLKHNYSNLD